MKLKSKKELGGDIKSLIPIKNIGDGIIELNSGKKIIIFKIEPTNLKLKTNLEQNAILEGYRLLLKRCNFDMQILIQTQKRELDGYIKNIKRASYIEPQLKEMIEDYIEFLKATLKNKEIVSRSFYVLVDITCENEDEVFLKISESFKSCDNEAKKCDFNETVKVFRNYLNRKIA